MASFIDVLVVIALFALRIGIPVAIVMGLGYLLKRMDRRWEAEARAEQAAQTGQAVQVPAKASAQPGQSPARRPGQDVPGPQMPFDPGLIRNPQSTIVLASGKHCWDVKGCSPDKVAQCPAYLHAELPCWQARTKAEHQMPDNCFGCDIFKNYPNL